MKKKVTIEGLAGMVQRGFTDAREELGAFRKEANGRFDGMENRLEALENHLRFIEKEILQDHRRRIERLEERLAAK